MLDYSTESEKQRDYYNVKQNKLDKSICIYMYIGNCLSKSAVVSSSIADQFAQTICTASSSRTLCVLTVINMERNFEI
jgi:hypothetical protein